MSSAAGRSGVFIGRILTAAVGISTVCPLLVEAQGAGGRIAGTVHDVTGTMASGAVV